MSTTFTAIHVLPNGKELTAEFTISDKDHDKTRDRAEQEMRKVHGDRRVHCWSIPAKPGTDFFEYMAKQRIAA